MSSRVPYRGRRALLLAVVLMGVLVGLVGMHHLALADEDREMAVAAVHVAAGDLEDKGDAAPAAPREDSGSHDSALLHLCLAILTAVAVVVAILLAWRRSAPELIAVAGRAVWAGPIPRAPPLRTPTRLALLGVSRT